MKILFSDSFLKDVTRKDINLRLSTYFLTQSNIGLSLISELQSKTVSDFVYNTDLRDIEGIWESKTNILKLYIKLDESNLFSSFGEKLRFNLGYFYYKRTINEEDRLAFILVPSESSIKDEYITIPEDTILDLCLGNNLVNIAKIPERECGFEFCYNNSDTIFLEGPANITGKNVFASYGEYLSSNPFCKRSYEMYITSGDGEYRDINQYISTTGEIIEDTYTYTKVTEVYITSPSAIKDNTDELVIRLGLQGGDIKLIGYFSWEKYKVSPTGEEKIESGVSDLSELLAGGIEVLNEGVDNLIKTTDFENKTFHVDDIPSDLTLVSYSADVRVSAINLLSNEVEYVKSNLIKVTQVKNAFAWKVEFNNTYTENGIPLVVTNWASQDRAPIHIFSTSKPNWIDPTQKFSLEDVDSNTLTVVSDYPNWQEYFSFYIFENEDHNEEGNDTILFISNKKSNSTNRWFPEGDKIPLFSIILGDTKVENFYAVQKPLVYDLIKLYEKVDDKLVEVEKSDTPTKDIGELYYNLVFGKGVNSHNCVIGLSDPADTKNMKWTLVKGGISDKTYYNEDIDEVRNYIDVIPKTGNLEIITDDSIEDSNIEFYTSYYNYEMSKLDIGDLIICKGTDELITENDWRYLICNPVIRVNCSFAAADPFITISANQTSSIKSIDLKEGFQSFSFWIKSNCRFWFGLEATDVVFSGYPTLASTTSIIDSSFYSVGRLSPAQWDYKKGVECSIILRDIGYDFAQVLNAGFVKASVYSDESIEDRLYVNLIPPTPSLLDFSRSTVFKYEEVLKDYGFWLDDSVVKLNNDNQSKSFDLYSPYKSLAAIFKGNTETTDPRKFELIQSNKHRTNYIKDQFVQYNNFRERKYYNTGIDLEYKFSNIPESDYPRYPVQPLGEIILSTANKEGGSYQIPDEPTISIPVYGKGLAPQLSYINEEKENIDIIEIPYNFYPDPDDQENEEFKSENPSNVLKFYIRSRYKFPLGIEDNFKIDIDLVDYPGLRSADISYTGSEIKDGDDWLYEFEALIDGDLEDSSDDVTIGTLSVTYRMDLETMVGSVGDDWIDTNTEEGNLIQNSYIDSLVPPITETISIHWVGRNLYSKPEFTQDDFSLTVPSNYVSYFGGEKLLTIKYPKEFFTFKITTTNYEIISEEYTDDGVIVNIKFSTRTPNYDNPGDVFAITDDLSSLERTRIINYFGPISSMISRTLTIFFYPIEGKTRYDEEFKITKVIYQYGCSNLMIFGNFTQDQKNFYVSTPFLERTVTVDWDTNRYMFYAAVVNTTAFFSTLSSKSTLIGGYWLGIESVSEPGLLGSPGSSHQTTAPRIVFSRLMNSITTSGYDYIDLKDNTSFDEEVTTSIIYKVTADTGNTYRLKLNVVKSPHPDVYVGFPEGYKSGCTLKFHSLGYCLDTGLFHGSPTTLIPEIDTALDVKQFSLIETINGVGYSLSPSFLELGEGSNKNRKRYQMNGLIMSNFSNYFYGLDQTVTLTLRSNEVGAVIWRCNVIQGYTSIGIYNSQKGDVVASSPSGIPQNVSYPTSPIVLSNYMGTINNPDLGSLICFSNPNNELSEAAGHSTMISKEVKSSSMEKAGGPEWEAGDKQPLTVSFIDSPTRSSFGAYLPTNTNNKLTDAVAVSTPQMVNQNSGNVQFYPYTPYVIFPFGVNGSYYVSDLLINYTVFVNVITPTYPGITSARSFTTGFNCWFLKPGARTVNFSVNSGGDYLRYNNESRILSWSVISNVPYSVRIEGGEGWLAARTEAGTVFEMNSNSFSNTPRTARIIYQVSSPAGFTGGGGTYTITIYQSNLSVLNY